MRKYITEWVLVALVVLLVVSNVVLATQVNALRHAQNDLELNAAISTLVSTAKISIPKLMSISPEFGSIGTKITIKGTGFQTRAGNTILMDYGIAASAISPDGRTLSFTIPKYLTIICTKGACPTNSWQEVVPKSYVLSVGSPEKSSNTLTLLVTASQTGDRVKITSLKPSSGPVNTKVTITGKGFAKTGNTVTFGYHRIKNLASKNGTTIVFTVPKILTYPCATGTPCPTGGDRITLPGPYAVRVTTGNDTSNDALFVVTAPTPTPSARR